MKKIPVIVIIFLLILIPSILAQDVNLKVKINGFDTDQYEEILVDSGSIINIDVETVAKNVIIPDVRIRGYMGGPYAIEIKSPFFELKGGEKFNFKIALPGDLDPSKVYPIHFEILNTDTKKSVKLRSLSYKGLWLNSEISPSNKIIAPSAIKVISYFITKEDFDPSAKINVSINDLGLSSSSYGEIKKDEQSIVENIIEIPPLAPIGTYDVITEVNYDNGHKTVYDIDTITITKNAMELNRKQAEVEEINSKESLVNPKEVIVNNTGDPKEITKTNKIEEQSEILDNKENLLQKENNILKRIFDWIKNVFSSRNS